MKRRQFLATFAGLSAGIVAPTAADACCRKFRRHASPCRVQTTAGGGVRLAGGTRVATRVVIQTASRLHSLEVVGVDLLSRNLVTQQFMEAGSQYWQAILSPNTDDAYWFYNELTGLYMGVAPTGVANGVSQNYQNANWRLEGAFGPNFGHIYNLDLITSQGRTYWLQLDSYLGVATPYGPSQNDYDTYQWRVLLV
jgi:hypothetical protein